MKDWMAEFIMSNYDKEFLKFLTALIKMQRTINSISRNAGKMLSHPVVKVEPNTLLQDQCGQNVKPAHSSWQANS